MLSPEDQSRSGCSVFSLSTKAGIVTAGTSSVESSQPRSASYSLELS